MGSGFKSQGAHFLLRDDKLPNVTLPSSFKGYLDKDGRITRLPAKHSKKLELCLALLERVEPEREYTEKEINNLFYEFVDDFALIRRTLVDLGHLQRDKYGRKYKRSNFLP